jgi:TP901 family phage tail tape measure protein
MGLTRQEMEAWADGRAPEIAPMMQELAIATGKTVDELAGLIKQEDAADVMDSIARAAGASSATMPELFDAMTEAGPMLDMFNVSADKSAAILGVLADNGIKGSEAGNAVRSMLSNMSSDAQPTIDAWNELGVSMYDTQGNMKDIDIVMGELGDALDGLPVEDQNRLMLQLAGTYGISAMKALLADGAITDMETAMDDAADTAKVADERMKGWNGANDALQGSLETLQIQVLTPFLENVLTPIVKELTNVVNKVTEWATENPELANGIILVLAGLALLIGILIPLGILISTGGAVVTGVTALATGLGAVATAAGGIALPMMAAILPIIAVGVAIAAVIAKINEFNALVGGAAAAAGAAAVSVGADQLAIDYATWQATGGDSSKIPFAYRTALEAGLTYDFNQANANWAAFNAGQTPGTMPRALGGPVSAGQSYLVGERGPELMVPSSSGHIVPNHALGGGGQPVVVYVNNYGSSPYEFAALVRTALADQGL